MSDDGYPRYIRPSTHELKAFLHFSENGLSPFWAFHSRLKQSDGKEQEKTVEINGEQVKLTLKKTGSNLAPRDHPDYQLETVPEYVLNLEWIDDSSSEERKTSYIFSPRWPGIETTDGKPLSFDPDYVGMNVHIQGSNLPIDTYPDLLQRGVDAFDVNSHYFTSIRNSSVIYDYERYVRMHRSVTGALVELGGVFDKMYTLAGEPEERYRKQVDDSRKIEGYLAYVTMDTNAVEEVFPDDESLAKKVQHYHPKYVRESDTGDDPLAHPKVGAQFKSNKNADGTVKWEDRADLRVEVDESLLNTLSWAGLPVRPDGRDNKATIENTSDGSPVFVADAHFEAKEMTEPEISIVPSPLPDLRSDQTDVVENQLTGNPDLNQSDIDVLKAVTGGGTAPVSASEVADGTDWSLSTVYRAVGRLSEIVERRAEGIGIRSKYLRDAIKESLKDAHGNLSDAVDAEDSTSTSAIAEWADANGFSREYDEYGRLVLRLGRISRSTDHKEVLKNGFRAWIKSGRDPAEYKSAKVRYRQHGNMIISDGIALD